MEESIQKILNDPKALLTVFLFFIPFIAISCLVLPSCLRKIARKEAFTTGLWGLVEVVLGIGFFIFLVITTQLLMRTFIAKAALQNDIIWALVVTAVSQMILCFFIIMLVKKVLFGGWKVLGLASENMSWNKFKWGVLSYISFLPVYFLVIFVSYLVFTWLGWKAEEQDLVKHIKNMDKDILVFVIAFLAIIVIPICEEFFFRVFLYTWLRSHLGVYAGIIVSAAIFSAVHNNALGFFPIMFLGIWLAFLYEKTQSLWVPASIHALHNGLTIGILLFS